MCHIDKSFRDIYGSFSFFCNTVKTCFNFFTKKLHYLLSTYVFQDDHIVAIKS